MRLLQIWNRGYNISVEAWANEDFEKRLAAMDIERQQDEERHPMLSEDSDEVLVEASGEDSTNDGGSDDHEHGVRGSKTHINRLKSLVEQFKFDFSTISCQIIVVPAKWFRRCVFETRNDLNDAGKNGGFFWVD